MYAKFYGLAVEPFSLSPDLRFCYRHPSFARAKAYLEFAVRRAEGFVVVTGRPGTGKTTLIQDLARDLRSSSLLVAQIDRTQVGADDLLRLVAFAFGLDAHSADKATLLYDIEHLLRRRAGSHNRAILIIDEAQNLPPPALEELRLITNLQDQAAPLVQIFLVGQEELRATIRAKNLEQLHQRIVAACHIDPLDPQEMRGYIQHRLLCAGWRGDPQIRGEALGMIHLSTRGIPRLVNRFCDRLLVHGGIEGRHVITVEDVHVVLAELRQECLTPQDAPIADQFRPQAALTPSLPDLTLAAGDLPPGTAAVPTPIAAAPKPAGAELPLWAAVAPPADRPSLGDTDAEPVRPSTDIDSPEQWTAGAAAPAAPDTRAPSPPAPPGRSRLAPWLATSAALALAGGLWLIGPQRLAELRQAVLESLAALAAPGLSAMGEDRGEPRRGLPPVPAPGQGERGSPATDADGQAEGTSLPSPGTPAASPAVDAMVAERPGLEIDAAPKAAPQAPVGSETARDLGGAGVEVEGASRAVADLDRLAATLRGMGLQLEAGGRGGLRLDLGESVPFTVDGADIPEVAIPVLSRVAGALAQHPDLGVWVIGHTDRSGSPQHNLDLSQRRAEAVRDQLAAEGVAPDRLFAEGRGMGEPLSDPGGGPVFRRRVELRIEADRPEGPGTAADLRKAR